MSCIPGERLWWHSGEVSALRWGVASFCDLSSQMDFKLVLYWQPWQMPGVTGSGLGLVGLVSRILWLGETACLICNFLLRVAACKTVEAYLSQRSPLHHLNSVWLDVLFLLLPCVCVWMHVCGLADRWIYCCISHDSLSFSLELDFHIISFFSVLRDEICGQIYGLTCFHYPEIKGRGDYLLIAKLCHFKQGIWGGSAANSFASVLGVGISWLALNTSNKLWGVGFFFLSLNCVSAKFVTFKTESLYSSCYFLDCGKLYT